jgi:mono/diheme cytochrome c family protein
MKKTIVIGAALLLAGGVAAPLVSADETVDLENGKEIYDGTCVACHGEDGKGTMAGIPNFTSKKGPLATKNDEALIESITDGLERPNADLAMPPLGGNDELTDEDVVDILAYLRKTFGPK